jgi:NarL family two-component system response regulator YdfI
MPEGDQAVQRPIRILLADDHLLFLDCLHLTLELNERMLVMERATTGHEVLHLCERCKPDILLLDLVMPGPPPAELVTRLRAQEADLKILVLTAHYDNDRVQALISAGVNGYILKEESLLTLHEAIIAVMEGEPWFSQRALHTVVTAQQASSRGPGPPLFTDRERQVIQLLQGGLTNNHIAEKLAISPRTVSYHLRNIYDKLGVETPREAIVRLVQLDLDDNQMMNDER